MVDFKLPVIILCIISLCLLVSCKSNDEKDQGDAQDKPIAKDYLELKFEYDGVSREGLLYIPDNLPVNSPLVLVLHGYSGTAENIMTHTGMNAIADENGFAVCYPQGLPVDNGGTHWNAWLSISEVDDVGFLSALVRYLHDDYKLDSDRTFICGFSNGGYMSYTLAVEQPEMFRAIASVAGTMSGSLWKNREFVKPIPLLQVHGTADGSIPISGMDADISGGWGGAPSIYKIIEFWAERNDCSTETILKYPPDTTAFIHSDGIDGNEVWYFEIKDWPHVWPVDGIENPATGQPAGINASEKIWEFFSKYN